MDPWLLSLSAGWTCVSNGFPSFSCSFLFGPAQHSSGHLKTHKTWRKAKNKLFTDQRKLSWGQAFPLVAAVAVAAFI